MRKITLLFAFMAIIISPKIYAGINSTTAWWNGATFESFTAGTDLKTGWTNNGGSPFVMSQTISTQTNGTATGVVLGFPIASATAFVESASQSGNRGVYKVFTNALSGYVYVKTSFYQSTSGTTYSLKNTAGVTVFEFGGNGSSSGNTLWATGIANTTVALGTRAKWADIEFILDIPNNKLYSLTFTFAGTTKSYSNINLPAGTDVKSLYVTMTRSYCAAGLDNTTFGQLIADNIKSMSGASSLQTLSSGNITSDFNVTSFTNVMAQDLTISQPDLNIQWSILDYGSLSDADKLLVTLTRNSSDFQKATLSAGNISADATITLQAVYGNTTLTKNVNLKALSVAGLKSSLATEIISSNALIAAITDSNPYITSVKNTLQGYVNAAQAVIDNASPTIEDATSALANIQSAQPAFTNSILPYNRFLTLINTVQGTYTAETRTAAFILAEKATLNSAISNASAARTTISNKTDIYNDSTALKTAYDLYNTEIPAYANLENQITNVTNRLTAVNPRKGDSKFLMFTSSSVDALTVAKTTAENELINSTTIGQLSTAQTNLATALTTFNNTPRVAPHSLSCYRIYTYGVDGGDVSPNKNILFAHTAAGIQNLAYTPMQNANLLAIGDSALWTITTGTTATSYIFQNKATGKYLSGTGFSDTSVEFTLPENKSQTGLIQFSGDPNFIYSIVNSSSKALEVDIWTSPYGAFTINSGNAERFRFAFQFEELQTPAISTTQNTVSTFSTTVGNPVSNTLSLAGTNLYGTMTLAITGTNANLFSVTPASFETTNSYINNSTVTITYTPTAVTSTNDVATLSIGIQNGNTLTYNLEGQASVTTSLENTNGAISIYPVLTRGTVNINGTGVERVQVCSLAGHVVKSVVKPGDTSMLNITDLTSGAYLVKVSMMDGSVKTQKVLLNK